MQNSADWLAIADNRRKRRQRRERLSIVYKVVVIMGIAIGFFATLLFGLGSHFRNQDIMLCESAKQSGNEVWLSNCSLFYQTNNPADIIISN